MKTVRIERTLTEDRTLLLEDLPFPPGATVAVTVEEEPAQPSTAPGAASSDEQRYPLRGTVLRYDDPFAPVAPEEDWDALR